MIVQDSLNFLAQLNDQTLNQNGQYQINLPNGFIKSNNYFDKIYISEIIIPISFYSIPKQIEFTIRVNAGLLDEKQKTIKIDKSSPSSKEFAQTINEQMKSTENAENISNMLSFQFDNDQGKFYFEQVSNQENIIQSVDIVIIGDMYDIEQYLGLPLENQILQKKGDKIYFTKIMNFIQHQIIHFYGNFIYGIQGMSSFPFAIVNTALNPQFSIYQQYFDMNMLQYKYNQEQSLIIDVKTQDGEQIILNNNFPIQIRFNFIKTFQIEYVLKELQQIKNILMKRDEKEEKKEQEELLQQLMKQEQELSGFIEY